MTDPTPTPPVILAPSQAEEAQKHEYHRRRFREGFRKAQNAAIDRCEVEMREGDEAGNAAISRCIEAILALTSRHFK